MRWPATTTITPARSTIAAAAGAGRPAASRPSTVPARHPGAQHQRLRQREVLVLRAFLNRAPGLG
ncbi:hypothetical protein [Amycolatopsis plumensis]|uniref:hypothetical protein n=1 Tax=Amycolatopsis plumensis TaxID=236508 RepID=UPI003609B75E